MNTEIISYNYVYNVIIFKFKKKFNTAFRLMKKMNSANADTFTLRRRGQHADYNAQSLVVNWGLFMALSMMITWLCKSMGIVSSEEWLAVDWVRLMCSDSWAARVAAGGKRVVLDDDMLCSNRFDAHACPVDTARQSAIRSLTTLAERTESRL